MRSFVITIPVMVQEVNPETGDHVGPVVDLVMDYRAEGLPDTADAATAANAFVMQQLMAMQLTAEVLGAVSARKESEK